MATTNPNICIIFAPSKNDVAVESTLELFRPLSNKLSHILMREIHSERYPLLMRIPLFILLQLEMCRKLAWTHYDILVVGAGAVLFVLPMMLAKVTGHKILLLSPSLTVEELCKHGILKEEKT